jgi:hypothetical protein
MRERRRIKKNASLAKNIYLSCSNFRSRFLPYDKNKIISCSHVKIYYIKILNKYLKNNYIL